jgi:hypothetical protein
VIGDDAQQGQAALGGARLRCGRGLRHVA